MHDLEGDKIFQYRIFRPLSNGDNVLYGGYEVSTLECAASLICLSELPLVKIVICKHMHIPNHNRIT